jgi:hypothetical protein
MLNRALTSSATAVREVNSERSVYWRAVRAL